MENTNLKYKNLLYINVKQNNHNLMILHFVYEGNETGEGGERTVALSIFGEFLSCWKKIQSFT